VVNPTEESHQLTSSLRQVKLRPRGKLYQIAPPSVDSSNQPGREPAVKIVESEQASFPETLQVPPVSVSVYEFEVEGA
jgi:alpha-L-arabinofuranosidase